MSLEVIDIILVVLFALFALAGFHYGFIRTAGSLAGLILGVLGGSYLVSWLADRFGALQTGWGSILLFIVTILCISSIVSWLVELLDELVDILSIIPFLKTINKILGGIVGFLEGVIALLAIAYLAESYLPEGFLRASIMGSQIISHLSWAIDFVQWILPIVS
ncbi:MAG: CvpA family protein [Patescibacteria group bacterium]|jgi:uncharacterized membrane protein required for colicin V production